MLFRSYNQIKEKSLEESKEIRRDFSWEKVGEIGYQTLIEFQKNHPFIPAENKININYLDGPKVEIVGDNDKDYHIEFLDENNKVVHEDNITNNMWTKCSRKYYTKWKTKINGVIVDELNLDNKRVLISLESKSIGDTIAWAPYAVEFAKKHNCKVILSTFHNDWFKGLKAYKDIEFVEPGSVIECYVVYKIGWFKGNSGKWDKFEMYPNQINLVPLQQTATDILGLEFKELNYGLNFSKLDKPIKEKYVIFAPNATSGCKEWSYENWVELSKLIKKLGYEVITLTKKPFYIEGTQNVWNESLNTVANYL